jgi:hypothetical protein
MENARFPLEEFEALFAGRFRSREELLREYNGLLAILDQLDQSAVPELSAGQKAAIFRQSWQGQHIMQPRLSAWHTVFRRPAVAFAAGIVLGCVLMLLVLGQGPAIVQPAAAAAPLLTVEDTGYTRVYAGQVVDGLYPQIENPKIVLEKTPESSAPQRVLYGTLDEGEVYVVWNL